MEIKKHKRTSPQNKAQFQTSKNKQNYITYVLFIFNFLHIDALKLIRCTSYAIIIINLVKLNANFLGFN